MDIGSIDGGLRRLAAAVSRRRLGFAAATVVLGIPAAGAGKTRKNKRCRTPLASCTKPAQCCGKASRCATSHGAGSNTCCGGGGAACSSDLTCCAPLMCEGGRCVQVETM